MLLLQVRGASFDLAPGGFLMFSRAINRAAGGGGASPAGCNITRGGALAAGFDLSRGSGERALAAGSGARPR